MAILKLEDVKKPVLYTTEEVAKYMGVTRDSVIRYIRGGLLAAMDIHNHKSKPVYRVSAQAVQDFYDRMKAREKLKQQVKDYSPIGAIKASSPE